MEFAQSARSTIGVEWELAIVDPVSRDLAPLAPAVIATAADSRIKGEFLTNTIELVSGVHNSVASTMNEMRELRDRALEAAASHGVALIGAGTHPFARWREQRVADNERYQRLVQLAGSWSERLVIFGVHNHIGIEDRAKVVPILRTLVEQLPLVLALSASSPFWENHDTGFASERTMLFQQLPTGGLPPTLHSWEHFEAMHADMVSAGMLSEASELRWDVRPAAHFGTIEARIADGAPSLDDLAAITALTVALVEEASRALDRGDHAAVLPEWFVRENKWRAARYGLDAPVIIDASGAIRPARELLLEAVERLAPFAVSLGATEALQQVSEIVTRGGWPNRQRQQFAKNGGTAIVDDLVAALQVPPASAHVGLV